MLCVARALVRSPTKELLSVFRRTDFLKHCSVQANLLIGAKEDETSIAGDLQLPACKGADGQFLH